MQRGRYVLFDIANLEATRSHDVAAARFGGAGDGAQERGLAHAIAGHQPDAIAVLDDEVEIAEQRDADGDAEVLEADRAHLLSLWKSWRNAPGLAPDRRPMGKPEEMGRCSSDPLGQPCNESCRA